MSAQTRKHPHQNATKQKHREQIARRNRRNRIYASVIGVVVLAVIAVVLMINANKPETPVGSITTVPTQTWPEANGKALGPANAKVVVIEYADFQCPICKEFDATIQPQIIDQYVKTGKIRFEYHHFIIIDANVGGTKSLHAAEASECAAEQGHFWDYHEMLFANQGAEGSDALSDSRLKAFAAALGLDTQKFNTCFDSNRYASNVSNDDAAARGLGLNGTPSVLVNGKQVTSPLDYSQVQAAINAALASSGQ